MSLCIGTRTTDQWGAGRVVRSSGLAHVLTKVTSRSILVIDDDPDILETVRFVLENAGYRVHVAASGREGLDVLASIAPLPCLILLDLMMPVMNGYETLTALKAFQQLAQIPVAILTASGAPKPPLASELLRKPVDIDTLMRTVSSSCNGAN